MKTITPAEPLYRVAWVRRDDPEKRVRYTCAIPQHAAERNAELLNRHDQGCTFCVCEEDVPYTDPDFLNLREFSL